MAKKKRDKNKDLSHQTTSPLNAEETKKILKNNLNIKLNHWIYDTKIKPANQY
jgi:hypothetical protein